MTIVTTYICDKCGHSQEKCEQMWDVGIVVAHKDYKTQHSFSRDPVTKKLWCRSCVVKLGLLPAPKDDPITLETPPTFDDMIREIIQEEIEAHNP